MTAPAKTLPHNLDAEASVLGGVMLKPELLRSLDALEVDDFYDNRHKVVFQAMRNLASDDKPIDVVTLENEIERADRQHGTHRLDAIGGVAFLGELALRVPTADNVVAYAKLVRSAALIRRVAMFAGDLAERSARWAEEPDELVAQATRALEDITARHVEASEPVHLITVGQALEDLAKLSDLPTYTTPFATLNDAIGFGGFLATQVYTVAAGTGRGKTSWVAEVAAFEAQRGDVIVATYEMIPGYFVARVAGGRLGVHSNAIIRGEVSMAKVMATVPHSRLFFLHKPTLKQIQIAAKRLAMKRGRAPLVIVDYIQKLGEEIQRKQHRPDPRLAMTEASASLLEIADDVRCPILSVSATSRMKNRALTNPRKLAPYELVDVAKESGAVEYDGAALIVLALSDDFDGDERVATMTVAKARFGTEVHIEARFDGRHGTWRDLGKVDRAVVSEAESVDLRVRIIRALGTPAKSKAEVVRRVGGRKSTVLDELEAMLADGSVTLDRNGYSPRGGSN